MPRQGKSPDQLVADLEAKRAAIDARLEKAKAKQKEQERAETEKCNSIIAKVVRKKMAEDAEFSRSVRQLLDKNVTRGTDRALLAKLDLLPSSDDLGQNDGASFVAGAGGISAVSRP